MFERLFGFIHVDNCCKSCNQQNDYNFILINFVITLLTSISIIYLMLNRFVQFEIKDWPIPMKLNRNTNIKRWLEDFHLYFKIHRVVDDSLKRSILIHHLDSKSYDTVRSLLDDVNSYKDLEDLIVRLFDKDYLNNQKYIDPFFKCKQENDESIQRFYARLFKLAQLAFPFNSTTKCTENLLRDRFYHGLKDNKLSLNLKSKFKQDEKLVKIVNFAINMEKNISNVKQAANNYKFVSEKIGFDQYGSFNDDHLKLKHDD